MRRTTKRRPERTLASTFTRFQVTNLNKRIGRLLIQIRTIRASFNQGGNRGIALNFFIAEGLSLPRVSPDLADIESWSGTGKMS